MLEDAGITGMPEVIRRVIARELGAPAGHGLMAYSWSLTHDPALRAQVLSDYNYWNIPLNSAVKEQLDRVNSLPQLDRRQDGRDSPDVRCAVTVG